MLDTQSDINTSPEAPGLEDTSETSARLRNSLSASIHLRRNDSWRPPDWRWQRAQMLLTCPETQLRDGDDEFVELALRFLQEDLPGSQSPALKRLLPLEARTAIRKAQQIHDCDDIGKWTLQAWLLTRESPEVISGKTSTPIEEIVWYGRLFFDVQDRLDCRSFIIHRVVGPKIHYGLGVKDVDVIWRFWAYAGGPYILESLLDDFIEAGRPDYSYLFDGTYRNADLPRERLLLQQAIRVQLLTVEDVMKLLSAALRDPEITARARTFGELLDSLVAPEMGFPSALAGGGDGVPVEDLQEISVCEVEMVGAA